MILECQHCLNTKQFNDKDEAIDEEWNWVEQKLKTGEMLITAACPDCPIKGLQEIANTKVDSIDSQPEDKNLGDFSE